MMSIKHFVILDATGMYPAQLGSNFNLPEGAIEVEHDAIDYIGAMYVDGAWEARPAIAAPAIKGGAVAFGSLPDGAVVTVIDIEAGVDLAAIPAVNGIVEFELADSAEYLIRAEAPLPWMAWEGRLTC